MRTFQGIFVITVLAMFRPALGSTLTVSNTSDSQTTMGSLRWAIQTAQPGDTINFSFTCQTTTSITVSSYLDISKNLTITGPGASCLTIFGTNQSRVFTIESGTTASISGLTIANGKDVIVGGGVFNLGTLSLSNCVVTGNFVPSNMGQAVGGGGIGNAGTLTLTNCSVSNNSTDMTGGAIRNANGATLNLVNSTISNNSSKDNGGGIWTKGVVNVSGSTFSGNSAAYGVSTSFSPEGGAIYVVGAGGSGGNNTGGSGTIVNSTFSGNSAKVYGGAISNYGHLSVSASTFSGNLIQNGGGGAINTSDANGGALTLKSSILAASSFGNCLVTGSGLVSMGYSLSTDNSCTGLNLGTDLNGMSAGLDPSGLQNNGGSTQTIALLSTSPAVDHGSCTDLAGNTVSTDQRGEMRPQGSTCDIGAFELESSANTVTNTNDSGSGSLRDAIVNAQDGSTIDFNLTLPATIFLTGGRLIVDKNLTIRGPGAGSLSINGDYGAQSCFIQNGSLSCTPPGAGSQIFEIVSGKTVSITGVTLENGNDNNGGALVNYGTLNLGDCAITGNYSIQGAGLNNQGTGTLVVNNCTVSGNMASGIGGGLFNAGQATITASTFSGNNAAEAAGAFSNGTLTITNSTFANNQAGSAVGGVESIVTLHLSNSTFFNNSSPSIGALFINQGTATMKGTLLAKGALGNNCAIFSGAIVSVGSNLSDDPSCDSSFNSADKKNTASGLDPLGLQDNGGPTKTIALIGSSAAIDVIAPASCTDVDGNTLVTDQRGTPRPQGAGCDIGAYEAMAAATTTTLSSSSNPSPYGSSVTFTATVAPQSGSGSPAGTVTFFDGMNSLGSAQLASGEAALATSALAGGQHMITASYGGGGNFAGSTSQPLMQIVNAAPTSTTLSSSLNPSIYGQTVSFTAVVSSMGGVPTGMVAFSDGGTPIGSASLSMGQAVLTTSTLTAGQHTITASYTGDNNFAGSTTPQALSQTVSKAAVSVTVVSSLSPSTYGQLVSFTATVTSTAGTPPGNIFFFDGLSNLIAGPFSETSGQAILMTSTLSAGSHTIFARYGGNANFASNESSGLVQVINQASTTASLAATPNPATTAQNVTLVATIVAQYGGILTGTVTFKEGTTKILGTGTVSGGIFSASASLNISLGQGSHTITAVYGGDNDATGSTSPAVTAVVAAPQATTTSISSSLNPSYVGQPVTFTAIVTPVSATGTVTFKHGQNIIGTAPLSSGQASLTISNLPAGGLSIVAAYSGDAQDAVSTSSSLPQTVLKASTATTIASFPNPSVIGEQVSFVAHVTVTSPNGAAPTGVVTFMIGNTAIGSAPVDQTGTAVLRIPLSSTGRYNVKAVYGGSLACLGSASTAITQVVTL